MLDILIKVHKKKRHIFMVFSYVSCGAAGMPGEEVCRGLITGLLHVQLAPWYVCAISHRLIWLWSEGKEADLCVGISTPACTCWSSPRCMAV